MMRISGKIISFFISFTRFVSANVEKAVFQGPPPLQIPIQHPTLEALQLRALSPEQFSLRTQLRAEFPASTSTRGVASWFLLEGLREGKTYEVRVCWSATQPTSFTVATYKLTEVFESEDLIRSLDSYIARQKIESQIPEYPTRNIISTFRKPQPGSGKPRTMRLLQISAAADYFTMNKSLMENVPPVTVDVILDPYLLNILPQSLGPTVIYLAILIIGSWYVATSITQWLQTIANDAGDKKNL